MDDAATAKAEFMAIQLPLVEIAAYGTVQYKTGEMLRNSLTL